MEATGVKPKLNKVKISGRVCSVIACSSSDYNLAKWAKSLCMLHHCIHDECVCQPPYVLHSFPTNIKKPLQRQKWLQLLNRTKTNSKKLWAPGKSSRVCSKHFIDGYPTEENPYPTENLGYDSKRKVENVTSITANPRKRKRAKVSTPKPALLTMIIYIFV